MNSTESISAITESLSWIKCHSIIFEEEHGMVYEFMMIIGV